MLKNWISLSVGISALALFSNVLKGTEPNSGAFILPLEDESIFLPRSGLGFIHGIRVVVPIESVIPHMVSYAERGAQIDDRIDKTERGVVFRYATQSYGLINGEISFELRQGVDVQSLPWGNLTAALQWSGIEGRYAVTSENGVEFVRVLTMLEAWPGVVWARPAIEDWDR